MNVLANQTKFLMQIIIAKNIQRKETSCAVTAECFIYAKRIQVSLINDLKNI